MFKVISSSKANLESDLNTISKKYPGASIQVLPDYTIILSGVTVIKEDE